MQPLAPADTSREAHLLLRGARAATLATVVDGQPFATLVTPAPAPDRSLLLLLSGLAEHTRHLAREPRCALLLTGTASEPNPQTAPRLTLTGHAAPEPEPVLWQRWVARHPYAAFYASLPDFRLWRVQPASGLYVAGFGRAYRLGREDIVADDQAVARLAAAEPGILAHCNTSHASALGQIAQHTGAAGQGWRMVACDVDGCDLAQGMTVHRVNWSLTVSEARGVRSELVRLAREARAA